MVVGETAPFGMFRCPRVVFFVQLAIVSPQRHHLPQCHASACPANNVNTAQRMELARITARGQATIPKQVREAANLNTGDLLSFEVQSDHLVVRKLPRADDAYLQGVSRTLDEWNSPEDETAWHHL